MSLKFGCQALTMVFEFFDLVSGVDECFTCIKRLENLIDGTYVS